MVIFDTSVLVLSLDSENAEVPLDPNTGEKIKNCKARIDHLIENLSKAEELILVPTPVLSEYLIKAGPNKDQYVDKIISARNFDVGDFNARAAIELTLLNDIDLAKRALDENTTKAKLKVDRQIIAIAKVYGAECVYTCDEHLARFARRNNMRAVMAWDLPEPPDPERQGDIFGDA